MDIVRLALLVVLTAAGALTRNTAFMIPLMAGLMVWRTPRRWWLPLLLGVTYLMMTLLIALTVDHGARYWTVERIWELNRLSYPEVLLSGTVYVLLIVAALRSQVPERRLLWTLVPYLAAVAIYGAWRETRLYVVIAPLVLVIASIGVKSETKD